MSNALQLPKFSKKKALKESGNELDSKKCFQRQSVTKYFRLALVLCERALQLKSLITFFWDVLASKNKIFIFAWRLGTRPSFDKVLTLSNIS